jgi:hypothetical protein
MYSNNATQRMFSGLRVISAAVALVLIPLNVYGQGTSGTIQGTLTDTSGAAIVDAAINVKNTGTGIAQTTSSDAQGRYVVPNLNVGAYEVQATKTGFTTVIRSGLDLTVGSQLVVDISMQIGQSQQTVTVEAQASAVETTSAALSNLVESTQMRELPLNGRNFSQLLTLAPGVIATPPNGFVLFGATTGYSVAGARPEGQAFLLDNSDIQDWWNHGSGSGATGSSLGIDAIAEFQTLTNTYSAQFGGNGSVINAVSKSGTNMFHGSAYEFLRNSDMDARNFFDGASAPAYRRNQFGGTFGGPIKKDKAFFFVNDERLISSLGQTKIASVPDANARNGIIPINGVLTNVGVNPAIAPALALYPATSLTSPTGVVQIPEVASQVVHENYLLARIDYTFSDKDSLFGRYVYDRGNQLSPFPGFGNSLPTWPEVDTTGNHFVAFQERHIFRPNLLNLLSISFNRPNDSGTTTNNSSALYFQPVSTGWLSGNVTVSGLNPLGPGTTVPYNFIQNKYTEADDVVWTHGANTITAGATVTRQQDNANGPVQQSGSFAFTSLQNFLTNKPTSYTGGIPGQYNAARSIREILYNFYVNDSWKVSSRLTVNLGLRYSPTSNPTETDGRFHQIANPPFGGDVQVGNFWQNNPSLMNWDPRVGIAYDPFNDHKTSVRAGFGIFHDPLTARLLGSCTFATLPAQTQTQLNPVFPIPVTAATEAASLPSVGTGCDWTNKSTPYGMQYNLNVQRQLGGSTVLTVGYVGSRGLHLGNVVDANAPLSSGNSSGPYASIVNVGGVPTFVSNPRPNPAFSTIGQVEFWGSSRYNSMQVNLQRHLSHNWQGQMSYTWSRSIDNGSSYFGESGGFQGGAENPRNLNFDKGPSSFNRNQALTINSLYILPFKGNKFVEGWQVSGIFTLTTGAPLTVTTGVSQAWTPVNSMERPNYVAGCDWRVGKPTEWYNPACFSLPAVGIIGNLGRFNLVGPGLVNTDFALMKETNIPKISEAFRIQFRAELFNIFNHANFSLPLSTNFISVAPGTGFISPVAGLITSTTTTSRQIQLALKVIF